MNRFLLFLILISCKLSAQITFETNYNNNVYYDAPGLMNFSAAGYKYVFADTDQIVLYNLNHSVYRTISMPNMPSGSFNFRVRWVSDELFNTNPADIEYVLTYESLTTSFMSVRVYDENGNILLSRDTCYLPGSLNAGIHEQGIVHTSAGVKMLLRNQVNSKTTVYALPGVLPCTMCDQGVMSGLQPNTSSGAQSQQIAAPYPNPTQSSITLPYSLPNGTSTGEIIIYNMIGREVKRYSITSVFSSLVLETSELASGTYSYSIQTTLGISPGSKFSVVQ
jgi:hypothetical protein